MQEKATSQQERNIEDFLHFRDSQGNLNFVLVFNQCSSSTCSQYAIKMILTEGNSLENEKMDFSFEIQSVDLMGIMKKG